MPSTYEIAHYPNGVTVHFGLPNGENSSLIVTFVVPPNTRVEEDVTQRILNLSQVELWINAKWNFYIEDSPHGTLPSHAWQNVFISPEWVISETDEGKILQFTNLTVSNHNEEAILVGVMTVPRAELIRRYIRSNYRRTSVEPDSAPQLMLHAPRGDVIQYVSDEVTVLSNMLCPSQLGVEMLLHSARVTTSGMNRDGWGEIEGEHVFAVERHDEQYGEGYKAIVEGVRERARWTRVPKRGEIVMKQKGLKSPQSKKKDKEGE